MCNDRTVRGVNIEVAVEVKEVWVNRYKTYNNRFFFSNGESRRVMDTLAHGSYLLHTITNGRQIENILTFSIESFQVILYFG